MVREKEKTKNTPAIRKSTEISTGARLSDLVDAFDDDELAEQQKSDGEFGGGRPNYFKFGELNLIRPCPKRKGAKVLYKEAARHGVRDAGEGKWKPVICVGKMRPPGRCYICEVLAVYERRAKTKEDRAEVQDQMPRWGAFWNVIDMKNPEAGSVLAWVPISIHKWIKEQTGIADNEIDKRPWDIEEGFPIRIKRDAQNKYTMKFMEKDAERLDDECYLGMADLEAEGSPPTPVELFRIAKHMATNYDILDKMDWDDVEFNNDDGPKRKKKRPADDDDDVPAKKAKRKPVVEEDEDDEEEDDDEDYAPVKGRTKAKVVEEDDDEDEAPVKRKKTVVEPIIEVPKKKAKKKSVFDDTDDAWPSDDDDDEPAPKKKKKV